MWSRARRFANVYAFATIDSLSALLWLSAWAAVASYVSAGKGHGSSTDSKKTGCDNFKFGSPGRCKLSETIIVFGVFEMCLFVATSFISFRAVMTFKRTGMMPENLPDRTSGNNKNDGDFSAQTQNDFSTNMRNDEEDFDSDQYGGGHDPRQDYAYQKPMDDAYTPLHQNEQDHDDIGHLPSVTPTSPLNNHGLGLGSYDTSYRPNAGGYGGMGTGVGAQEGPLHMPMPPR
jgi:translocation protein SEC72